MFVNLNDMLSSEKLLNWSVTENIQTQMRIEKLCEENMFTWVEWDIIKLENKQTVHSNYPKLDYRSQYILSLYFGQLHVKIIPIWDLFRDAYWDLVLLCGSVSHDQKSYLAFKVIQFPWKIIHHYLSKCKMHIPFDPTILKLLGSYLLAYYPGMHANWPIWWSCSQKHHL